MSNHKRHYWVKHIDGYYQCGCGEKKYPRPFTVTFP